MLDPQECCICKSYQTKVKDIIKKPIKLVISTAEETIKISSKTDSPALYLMIKDENLIAKECKCHDKCYANFTRGFVQRSEV